LATKKTLPEKLAPLPLSGFPRLSEDASPGADGNRVMYTSDIEPRFRFASFMTNDKRFFIRHRVN
jgi:hypothetical protein